MSVWAHVGATESLRVCVHWLWFRKTNRMKGPGGGRVASCCALELSCEALTAAAATGPSAQGGPGQAAQPRPAAQKATSV